LRSLLVLGFSLGREGCTRRIGELHSIHNYFMVGQQEFGGKKLPSKDILAWVAMGETINKSNPHEGTDQWNHLAKSALPGANRRSPESGCPPSTPPTCNPPFCLNIQPLNSLAVLIISIHQPVFAIKRLRIVSLNLHQNGELPVPPHNTCLPTRETWICPALPRSTAATKAFDQSATKNGELLAHHCGTAAIWHLAQLKL